ncbi:hypothetical protein JKF63_01738 [Porcisia hertigi]|uniref:Piezo non-specific cation channel R-Ras-binding domain-containing protein n=1 Tax=Porcisia hertigi TaxID=2761500 RepID=A0A836HIN1_9TRYP|nr:hypothetical protein JKF63_01738 [Porcisia hertigi]
MTHALASGAYLFLVLHLLFLLTVVWQNAIAASLLLSFFLFSCLQSVALGVLEAKPQHQPQHEHLNAEPGDVALLATEVTGSAKGLVAPGCATPELPASDSHHASYSVWAPPTPREERGSASNEICGKRFRHPSSCDIDPPSNSSQHGPCLDAGDISLIDLHSPPRDAVDDTLIYSASGLGKRSSEKTTAKNVRTGGHQDDTQAEVIHVRGDASVPSSRVHATLFYLSPRTEWVFAAALSSLVTACAAGILFGILYSSSADDAVSAGSVFPGWATTPAAKSLLAVSVGVQVDRPDSKLCFGCTTACLAFVSLTSWCLLLSRALGRCAHRSHALATLMTAGARVTSTSTWSRVQVGWNTALRLLASFFTSAPYSLVWVGVAGVGQGTVLGLLSLSLVMVVVVAVVLPLSSRVEPMQRKQRDGSRQRWWTLYACLLLCLWGVQTVVLLPPVQHSLKASRVWSGYSRWLDAVGAVSTAPQHSSLRWRIVQAIGLWWAGMELMCYHAASHATPTVGLFENGWVRRELLLRGFAQKDETEWTRAINRQRAAHRKLQQLRLERESYSPPSSRSLGDDQRRRTRTHQQQGAQWSGNPPRAQRGAPYMNGHAPFGSNVSYCCCLDREDSQPPSPYVAGGRSDGHQSNPTFLRREFLPSKEERVDRRGTCWTTDAASAIHPHSNSSICGCFSGRYAQWQCSEIASAHPSPASGEGEPEVVLITATAAVVLGDSAAERLKRDDAGVEPSLCACQGAAQAQSPSPVRCVGEGDEGDKNIRHGGSGAYRNKEHRAHRWSASWSHSSAHSPFVFSVTASGHRAGHSRLHGTIYAKASPCRSGGSGSYSTGQRPSMAHSVFANASVVDRGPPFEEEATHPRPAFPPEEPAHPDEIRSEQTSVSPRSLSAKTKHRGADTQPPLPSSLGSLCRKARLFTHRVVGLIRIYLQHHTVPLPVQVDMAADKGATGAQVDAAQPHQGRHPRHNEDVDHRPHPAHASQAPSTAANGVTPALGTLVDAPLSKTAKREAVRVVSLWGMLKLYLMLNWSGVCALLMLIDFAVCGTVVNLLPSFVSIAYLLLQRPWPPLWFLRAQVLYSILSLLVKGAVRVYLLTMTSYVSLTTCRWLGLVLPRVDVTAPSALVVSSMSPSSSAGSRDYFHPHMWMDLVLNGSVVAAVSIQWVIVYPDHFFLWNHRREAAASVLTSTLTSPENASLPAREARQDKLRRGVAKLWRNCKRRVRRWNEHRCGAGSDYYAVQLFFDGLSLVLFGCAYYAIVPADTAISEGNLLYAVQQNRLPGIFVATALALVVVLFLERIIYVLQSLVAKYVLHLFLALAYHALYVIWRTTQNGKEGSRTMTSVAATASVSLLLAAKLASLWCSCLQLRDGYALHRLHDAFTIKTDLLHWLGNVTFRAVPFLMELRVLLDWSFSATTLKVQHWLLLEDIHHTVYRRYVDIHDLHSTSRHQGRRFPYLVRFYQGVLGFTIILFVLFFPLFWYSTFSPQVRASRVTTWTTEVAFSGMLSAPLFSADATTRPSSFDAAATLSPGGARVSAISFLRFAAVTDTWQTMHVAACSTRMWSYTPRALQEIVDQLDTKTEVATLTLRNRLTRDGTREASMTTFDFQESFTLPPASITALSDALKAWRTADEADSAGAPNHRKGVRDPLEVSLPFEYTPYVLNTGMGVSLLSSTTLRRASCVLTLHHVGRFRGFTCVECVNDGQNSTSATTLGADTSIVPAHSPNVASMAGANKKLTPLTFVVASNDVATVHSSFSLIPSVGIIALYTSFVLVMSSCIRNYFSGDAHRVVLLQLANPEPVAELLRYLYLARSSANNGQTGDLVLEQLLFLELLDLLRSPERLLRLGGRRVDDYVDSTYRQALFDAARHPFSLSGNHRG